MAIEEVYVDPGAGNDTTGDATKTHTAVMTAV